MLGRKIFIFLGPPGSGKGTQSDLLGEKLGWPVIATGELLRWHLHHQTAIGQRAQKYMDLGKLVPDKIVEALVAHRLAKPDTRVGVIFDGDPRDSKQLTKLIGLLKRTDRIYVVEIRVGDREVINRLSGRRVCDCGASYHLIYRPTKVAGRCDLCGKKIYLRDDDRPAIVKQRLKDYQTSARPLLKYGHESGRLLSYDGEQSIKALKSELWREIGKIIKK